MQRVVKAANSFTTSLKMSKRWSFTIIPSKSTVSISILSITVEVEALTVNSGLTVKSFSTQGTPLFTILVIDPGSDSTSCGWLQGPYLTSLSSSLF